MTFDVALIFESLPVLISAATVTVQLTVCILLLGLVIAVPVALANSSANRGLIWISEIYIMIFRGTPALVQLFIIYFGLSQFEFIRNSPFWFLLRDAFFCAVIALGLNSGAYTGRMFAGALKAIPEGQIEAAKSLAMKPFAIFVKIKAPLAVRMVLPAYGNEIILSLKATALASAITVQELMGKARSVVNDTYAPYEVFIAAGIVYLALTFMASRAIALAERWLALASRGVGIEATADLDTAK